MNDEEKVVNIKGMNIYQKMSQATMDIERVKKNLSVSVGKGSYKAVGEGAVLAAVKPIEIALGIYSYPYSRTITETAVLVNTKTFGNEVTERKEQFMRIETLYRFVNVDNPTEFVDVTTYGDGIDSGDKAPGKAMTYADKYALLKAYKIETGDDPDQEGSKEYKTIEKKTEPTKPSPISKVQVDLLLKSVDGPEHLAKILNHYKVDDVLKLNVEQATQAITHILQEKSK